MKKLFPLLALFALLLLAPLNVLRAEPGAVGQRMVLTATAEGDQPITFEWLKNGTKVADGPTLTVEKLALADAGTYSVRAVNKFGSSVSPDFVLEVGTAPTAPVIKSTFSNLTVTKQSRVVLGIAAVGNDLSYKWQKGSSLLPGATGASYEIPKVNPSHAGTYAVTVSNPGGSVTASAKLSVR